MRRASVVCWDVNGYYRSLGIGPPFVHATQRQIREAYLARDGQNDPRMTWAFKTFLNARDKAVYDAMPLGRLYPDPDVLYAEKVRSIESGDTIAVTASVVDGEIVYDVPEGYEMVTTTDSLDSEPPKGQDGSRGPAKDPQHYPYTVLLADVDTYDGLVLARWQELLLQAAQDEPGAPDRIGLGVTQGKGGWIVGSTMGIPVAVLDRWTYPTLSAARVIIAEMAR